jgi:hypothetical protein
LRSFGAKRGTLPHRERYPSNKPRSPAVAASPGLRPASSIALRTARSISTETDFASAPQCEVLINLSKDNAGLAVAFISVPLASGRSAGPRGDLHQESVLNAGGLEPLRNAHVECVNVLLGGFEPAQLHR